MGEQFSDKEVDEIIAEVDIDGDGQVRSKKLFNMFLVHVALDRVALAFARTYNAFTQTLHPFHNIDLLLL